MTLQDFQAALRRQPFEPFRFYVTDGVFEVRHQELCVLGRRSVFLGLRESETNELVYDQYVLVDLAHITRLEPAEKVHAEGNGR